MRIHPRRARVNPSSPRAWGTSDRNGFVSNVENMRFQWDWAGTSLVNKRILVSQDELDKPQRQLGTVILPPDPMPVMNARPEPYAIDEVSNEIYTAENGIDGYVTEDSGLIANYYVSSGN